MAVYTKLSFQEISDFLQKSYSIGNLVDFKEIIDGIDNSNYIVKTDQGNFIFTIFESRIDKKDLPFFMNLKLHLAKKDVCCPEPIKNNSGFLISDIGNKSASIVTFLSGATLKPQENGLYNSITKDNCFEVGKNLGLLHNKVMDFDGYRKNDLGIDDWRDFFNKMSGNIDGYQADLVKEITSYIDFLESEWSRDLPSGVVHADLFPDNVFFDENGHLSGIIDFYFSANDLFIYDLAVTVNAWCFDEKNQFDEDRFKYLLDGYKSTRGISKEEIEFLNIALVGASLRFLLTRLHDLFHTPKDSLVKIKNPQEYLHKIRFFYKNFLTNKIV